MNERMMKYLNDIVAVLKQIINDDNLTSEDKVRLIGMIL